jgi:hypothetical protein
VLYNDGLPSSSALRARALVSQFGLYAVAILPIPPAINATDAVIVGGDTGNETDSDVVAILAGALGSVAALMIMGSCLWWSKSRRKQRSQEAQGGEGKRRKGTEFGRRFMLVTSDGALPLESSPPPHDTSGGGGWEGGTVFLSPARRHTGFEGSQDDATIRVPVRISICCRYSALVFSITSHLNLPFPVS